MEVGKCSIWKKGDPCYYRPAGLTSVPGKISLVLLCGDLKLLECDERKVTRNGQRPQGQDSGGVAEVTCFVQFGEG